MRCWLWPEMCWCKNPPACILRRQSRRYYRVVGRRARLWWAEIALAMAVAGWIAYALTAQPHEPSVGIEFYQDNRALCAGPDGEELYLFSPPPRTSVCRSVWKAI